MVMSCLGFLNYDSATAAGGLGVQCFKRVYYLIVFIYLHLTQYNYYNG